MPPEFPEAANRTPTVLAADPVTVMRASATPDPIGPPFTLHCVREPRNPILTTIGPGRSGDADTTPSTRLPPPTGGGGGVVGGVVVGAGATVVLVAGDVLGAGAVVDEAWGAADVDGPVRIEVEVAELVEGVAGARVVAVGWVVLGAVVVGSAGGNVSADAIVDVVVMAGAVVVAPSGGVSATVVVVVD